MIHEIDVLESQSGIRIDKFLSDELPEMSRSYIQKLIKDDQVTVNGKIVKANYKLWANDFVVVCQPELKEPDILAENIPLHILYEDDDLLIILKSLSEWLCIRRQVIIPEPW